jgi:hypothetical protein
VTPTSWTSALRIDDSGLHVLGWEVHRIGDLTLPQRPCPRRWIGDIPRSRALSTTSR